MKLFRYLSKRNRSNLKQAYNGQNLHDLLNGYRSTALLYTAARLKIPDLISENPRNSQELSNILNAHPPALLRLMRGLVALGICLEMPDGRFQITPSGSQLRSDSTGSEYSLAILNGEEYAAAWNHLPHSVMTGEAAFDRVFGESPWQHRKKNPELDARFNAWLEQGASAAGREISKVFDFSGHRSVTDVGGSQGALLVAVLQAHPTLQGFLFDQPHVISAARLKLKSAVGSRCQCIEGDFFKSLPPGTEIFILKSILHDWDDDKSLVILKNCHAALKPGGTLLVVEKIMPDITTEQPAIIMGDLHMLAVTGGRERTLNEFKALFFAAGFELRKTTLLSTGHTLLETTRI